VDVTRTPEPQPSSLQFIAIAVFGLVTLLGIIWILHRVSTEKADRWISHTLLKLYGLVSVAVFAVILAAVSADQTVKTAGFTVLGTIAGFLAGKPDPPSGSTDP